MVAEKVCQTIKLGDRAQVKTKCYEHHHREQHFGWHSLIGMSLSILSALFNTQSVRAAERIEFSYDILEFYLSVEALENYAKTGSADSNLDFYFQFLSSAAEEELQSVLHLSHDMSPWEASQLLYSPIGEESLQNIGAVIQTESGQNGFYALRAAIIQSAADPEGLSVLGVLQHFPSPSIRVDINQVLELAKTISEFKSLTKTALTEIHAESNAAALANPVDLASLPPLAAQGSFQFAKQTLDLRDEQRDRPIPTDLYVPDFGAVLPASIPVIVYSHGYGETRETAAPYLELLASYGFVVIAPEHVGSDYQYQQDLLIGLTDDSFASTEFVNRPLDLSFALDVLEQKNATEFGDRLNLQRVGAVGHSFGGYTVLVAGGATVDLEQLQTQCESDFLVRSLDTALLLQCRALELKDNPQYVELMTSGQLRDPRIQAVVAANPVAGAILGEQGLSQIDIPVILYSGASDPVTPLVPEQLRAFSWMTTPNKYLLVADNAAHDQGITELVDRVLLPSNIDTEADSDLDTLFTHLRSVGLAFVKTYVAGRSDYQPYLQPAYIESLSVEPFDFSLIREFSSNELSQLLEKM